MTTSASSSWKNLLCLPRPYRWNVTKSGVSIKFSQEEKNGLLLRQVNAYGSGTEGVTRGANSLQAVAVKLGGLLITYRFLDCVLLGQNISVVT